jgi:hypothetical protein
MRYRSTILLGTSTSQIALSVVEQGTATLLPFIRHGFGLSAVLTRLFGMIISVGRPAALLPSGQAVGTFGNRRVLLTGGMA